MQCLPFHRLSFHLTLLDQLPLFQEQRDHGMFYQKDIEQ